jgi:hypothetical protein
MLTDAAFNHVNFDISWDEVAKYAVASPQSIDRVATMLNRYPNRFLFGTDTVAPAGPQPYYAVFDMWAPSLQQADAGGESGGAEGQLRTDFQRRTPPRPGVGTSKRQAAQASGNDPVLFQGADE